MVVEHENSVFFIIIKSSIIAQQLYAFLDCPYHEI